MAEFQLPGQAEAALSKLQNTELSPMEEALFQAWAKANQIQKPDSPDDTTDYRGIYKETNGLILPNGALARMAHDIHTRTELEKVLQQQMLSHIDKVTQKHMGAANGAAESSAGEGASKPPAAAKG